MAEPWFDPIRFAWMPGTFLGVSAGAFGSLVGFLAPRGKAKGLVLAIYWTLLGASAAMLVAGAVAFFAGQPYGVWYGLGLPGVVGVSVLGATGGVITRGYRAAEERRMTAEDLE